MKTGVTRSMMLLACVVLVVAPLWADGEALRAHVEYLASEELAGRFTGSEGASKAADYLVSELERMGAEPLPGLDSYRLPFEFTAGVNDAGSSMELIGGARWDTVDDVQALSFSDSSEVSGGVVFAGYGLVVPEGQEFGYDSYATLDVEDKIVLVLRYLPEDVDQETRALLSRYSGLRYKALNARQRGAKALLVVTGPNSPNSGETIAMTFDTAIAGSGIVAASISGKVAQTLLASAGESLAELQTGFDTANPHVAGFEIADLEVSLSVSVEREHRTGFNVAGYLPSRRGHQEAVAKPYVLLGAHYDHLGAGRSGSSLADKDEAHLPHVGADDNASGVSAVLAAGARLAGGERDRGVVLAFWSGEELGLLGSTHFVDEGPLAIDEIAAYVNFDMVGRSRDNKVTLQAVGSSSAWPGLIERSNVPVGFDLSLQDDPYLPTDSSAFNQAGVPTLNFFTGSHTEYHRPSDKPDTLNYEDLERVAQLGSLIASKLANLEQAPEFVKVERRTQEMGDRDTVRAFTGTIPDYATEIEGLLLSGVIEGGPAAEAGLRKGDIIVEFGGQSITNIYDYTYALDAVKIDVPLEVVFLRDGERMQTTITPRARK